MDSDALVVSTIEVDVVTGKAQLRDFERAAETTAKKADVSAKQIQSSFKGATSGGIMSSAERAAFLKPIDDVHQELLAKIRGVGTASTAMGGEAVAASTGVAAGLGTIAVAASAAAVGIGLVAFGLDQFADAADPVTNLRRGFETLTARIDENADVMLGKAKLATLGLVSNMELMRLTNEAIILQLPVTSEKMAELAAISTDLGRAMGVEPTKALESIILGIGRESNRLLDNIGILVDVKKAHEDYAAAIGKSADELTEVEKRTGFFNATLEAGRLRVRELGGETATFSEYWKIAGTAVTDAKNKIFDLANVGLGNLITALITTSSEVQLLAGAFSALSDAAPKLDPLDEKIKSMATAAKDPGGLSLFENLLKYNAPLDRLGVTLGKDLQRIDDLRLAIEVLQVKLSQAPEGSDYFTVLTLKIKELQANLDKALGKVKEFKGLTGSRESKLPIPSNPNAPFGGGDPFGGRVPGLPLDTGIQSDMFGDADREKRLEMERASQDELLQLRIDSATEWSQTQQNLEMVQLEEHYARVMEAHQREGADTTALIEGFQIEQTNIERRYAEARGKIHMSELQIKLSAASMWLSMSGSVIGAVFEKNKKMQVASGLVNTAAAVVAALAFPPGPPATIPQAVATGIMGLAQVAKMRSTSIGGGGGGGGVSGGAAAGADFSNAIRVPGGNATGTTPTIVGAPTASTAQQAGSVVTTHVTIHAVDSKSIDQLLADPFKRRQFADAINTHNSGR